MGNMRKVLLLLVNVYLFLSTAILCILNLDAVPGGEGQSIDGSQDLMFFTVDSNLLMGLCSLILVITILKKRDKIPGWLRILELMATTSVGVTFFTVALFLGVIVALSGGNYFSLYTKTNLFFHFLNPLLAFVSFIWLMPAKRYSVKECFLGILPTVLYSVVYVIQVVILKNWPDIYYFTFGGQDWVTPIVVAAMYAMSFGIAVVLTKSHNRMQI